MNFDNRWATELEDRHLEYLRLTGRDPDDEAIDAHNARLAAEDRMVERADARPADFYATRDRLHALTHAPQDLAA